MEDSSLMTSFTDPEDSLINVPLPRGEACLPCRRRKSKCDGTRPVCRQCARGKRANDCRYDPSKAWSRNRRLQHRLMEVERRMRQMESKIQSDDPPTRSSPDQQTQFPFDDSHFNGLGHFGIVGNSAETFTPPIVGHLEPESGTTTSSSPEEQWFDVQTKQSGYSSSGFDSPSDGEGPVFNDASLTSELQELLLHAFLSHRHQLFFLLDVDTPHGPIPGQSPNIATVHPSLRNAVLALGCYFSRITWLGNQEAYFIDQACDALRRGLLKREQLVDLVQACCLLASHSFLKGNILETNYYVAWATRVATGLGLHQILPLEYGSPWALNNSIAIHLQDGSEMSNAAGAFWKMFVVDRLYSVALGVPPTLIDDRRPRTRIRTPLPDGISSFQSGEHSLGDSNSPLSAFFNGFHEKNFSELTESQMIALYAKVAELFERASRLCYAPSTDQAFITLENCLSETWSSLPLAMPARSGANFARENLSYSLMTLRSLVHAATVQLHRHLSLKELSSHAKSLVAAEHIVTIIREYWDADFAYFDPILGTAWTFVAEVLLRERMLGQHAEIAHDDQVNGQLDTVVSAMKRLAALFPVVGKALVLVDSIVFLVTNNASPAIQLNKVEQSISSFVGAA